MAPLPYVRFPTTRASGVVSIHHLLARLSGLCGLKLWLKAFCKLVLVAPGARCCRQGNIELRCDFMYDVI